MRSAIKVKKQAKNIRVDEIYKFLAQLLVGKFVIVRLHSLGNSTTSAENIPHQYFYIIVKPANDRDD